MKNKYGKITLDGLIFNNPTFVLVLGTCPTLAMTSNASDAFGMGISVLVVLTLSNIIISALRRIIPNAVRIPAFIVIIATLVTLLKLFLNKFIPDLYASMGTFLPLIVVNCMILGRAEAYASKNGVLASAVDGIANGIGFTVSLVAMGIIREFIGSGSIFGLQIMDFGISFFAMPMGAFMVYGICIALFVYILESIQRAMRIKKTKRLHGELLNGEELNKEEA
ncbi:MAG: electron transport complex subunit RsxE [Clostridia bacterium]|nr:electron transport complex subunit RsxE [Clostridia bacterium]